VSKLLDEPEMPLDDRLSTSAHTIMVIPTIAYYVGALAEVVKPCRGFDSLVTDGTLYEALYDAALLVRLLNDVGTNLLRQPEPERAELFRVLRRRAERKPEGSLYDLLRGSLEEYKSLFTRIRKDVLMREFNVCMTDAALPALEALPGFESNLVEVKRVYAERKTGLARRLASITERLRDPTVSRVVDRFVGFHETLYTRAYDDPFGEYAV